MSNFMAFLMNCHSAFAKGCIDLKMQRENLKIKIKRNEEENEEAKNLEKGRVAILFERN